MLCVPSNKINLICFANSSEKKTKNVDNPDRHLSTANHTDYMPDPDNATRHKRFVEAIDYLGTIATQPVTREIARAIKVVKVRDREI